VRVTRKELLDLLREPKTPLEVSATYGKDMTGSLSKLARAGLLRRSEPIAVKGKRGRTSWLIART